MYMYVCIHTVISCLPIFKVPSLLASSPTQRLFFTILGLLQTLFEKYFNQIEADN